MISPDKQTFDHTLTAFLVNKESSSYPTGDGSISDCIHQLIRLILFEKVKYSTC